MILRLNSLLQVSPEPMAGAALSGISAAAAPFIAQLGVGTIALTLLDTAVDVVAKVLKWTFAPALEMVELNFLMNYLSLLVVMMMNDKRWLS